MAKKLDKKDLQIMDILARNCRVSHTTIGKAIKLSKDSVRNRIKRLEDEKFITNYVTFIDIRKFGLEKYHIHIRFNNTTKNKDEIIASLCDHPSVSFVNSFIGAFDIQLIVDTHDIYSFEQVKEELFSLMKSSVQDYRIFSWIYDFKFVHLIPETTLHTSFERKLDTSFSALTKDEFGTGRTFKHEEIDNLDVEIIDILCGNPKSTLQEIASQLQSNRETIKQRITNLVKKEIIVHFGANPDFDKFDYSMYMLLFRTTETGVKEDVIQAIKSMDNVFYAAKVSGDFSMIVYITTKSPTETKQAVEKLNQLFGKDLLSSDILVVDKFIKYRQFPEHIKEILLFEANKIKK